MLERARRRVECLEEAVVDGRLGAGERVQERGLPDVRVPGEGDRRHARSLSLLSPSGPLPAQSAQASLHQGDPVARKPAVRLQLALAGASRPHATAEPLQVVPQSAHPRQVVLELRELDLQLSLRTRGVLGKDVEDQLRAIDDACLERVLERPLLRRAQLLVDEEHLRAGRRVRVLELGELALADERPRIRTSTVLDDLADGRDAGGARELTELGELRLTVDTLCEDSYDEPALRLRPWCRVGLACSHGRIMPR